MPHFFTPFIGQGLCMKGNREYKHRFLFVFLSIGVIRHSQVQGHSKIYLTYILPSLHTLLETKGMCEVARILFQIL